MKYLAGIIIVLEIATLAITIKEHYDDRKINVKSTKDSLRTIRRILSQWKKR